MKTASALEDLRFAVEFAQLDLAGLSPRERQRVYKRVLLLLNRKDAQLGLIGIADFNQELLLPQLRDIAAQVINDLFRDWPGHTRLRVTLEFEIWREHFRPAVRLFAATEDQFRYQLVRLVQTVGVEKILRCAAPRARSTEPCGRIFVKATRKEFCSTRCQTRTYMRTHPDRTREDKNDGKTTRTRRR
jgi:hypothetical protein